MNNRFSEFLEMIICILFIVSCIVMFHYTSLLCMITISFVLAKEMLLKIIPPTFYCIVFLGLNLSFWSSPNIFKYIEKNKEEIKMLNNETNTVVLDFYDEFYAPLSIIFEKYIENCKTETMYKNDFKDIISRYKGKDLKFIYFIYLDHNYIAKYYFRNMTIKDFCRKNKNINIISLNNKFSTIYDSSSDKHRIATKVNMQYI